MVDFNESKIAEFAKSNEPILDEPITLEEIRKASTKLKTGKAAGHDSISNEMIKSSVSIIGPVLQILFNKVLNSGIFPQLWSVGYISPVFKASDIGDPNNAPINVKPAGGGGRAWGGDLIVFVGPGVGHLTDVVLPGEGIFESFFARRGDI